MTDSPDVTVLEIPARIADLGFRISIPSDWNSLELPEEVVDFGSPDKFFPLMLAAAPWAAVVLTVAARPGFQDGTLQDWTLFLLDSQGIRPTAFGPAAIGNVQGLAGVGTQEQEGTRLEMRFALFEDGGRLVYVGLLAPEAISAPLETVWKTALESFVLERPQGQNVPLGPGMGIMPERTAASPEPSTFTESDFGHYAKSEDSNTLDPEHPTNARFRDQGVGFVPNLLETDDQTKVAKLGASGIRAMIRVAYGWHVIDDGTRTMVLDPEGKVQISLNVIQREGRSIGEILDELQEEAVESYPNPEFLRMQDGGIWALSIRGIEVNNEAVEQLHMLAPGANDTALLRARVTADPPSRRFAANYADLILKSAEYGEPEAVAPEEEEREVPFYDEPEWMQSAERLERADRLEEAEQLIHNAIPSLHFAITTAELYRRRWLRLRESDPGKAGEARKQAAHWAHRYASYATSGGEGVALSQERDEFLRLLGPEPLG